MIAHYDAERRQPGQRLEVAFFRGGVPSDALLAAAAPHPVRLACSPADLSRAETRRLVAGGVRTIELEACTLHTPALRALRRGYAGPQVSTMLTALATMGVRRVVTLMPGLPSSSHHTAVSDARLLAQHQLAEAVRILPALALEGAPLVDAARAGRWTPMTLSEAVTTTLAMVEVLEEADIAIIRLGLQPGQDVPCAVVAGPYHPNLRHLVEGRRFYQRLTNELRFVPQGSAVEVLVNPRDLSWARGTANANVRALRAHHALSSLSIRPGEHIPRGDVRLARS